jgi:hypothetical protein
MGAAMLKTIIVFAIAFARAEYSIAQEIWGRYCNARFGQCADVPRSYKSDPILLTAMVWHLETAKEWLS